MQPLFTIGHSTHSIDTFLDLLAQHGITAVADVRSSPRSRWPQFNRDELSPALRKTRIDYVFLGRELGARRTEPDCYEHGQIVYDRVANLPLFLAGIERVLRGMQSHRIALMCAEQEPLDCHRGILICRALRRRSVPIRHILSDGTLEDHSETERRLLRLTKTERNLLEPELTPDELLARAYAARGRDLGYRPPAED
jgi:uncharacterized protein (DUF488 family)